MKVVVIEDEKPAMEKICRLINKYDQNIEIIAKLNDLESSIDWFKQNKDLPDLVFSDIQLQEGTSFDIFKEVNIDLPIIFTTAFDQYAIKAFELNSIDYLLKPIKFENLSDSIDKYQKRLSNSSNENLSIKALNEIVSNFKKPNKTRFMVKIRDRYKTFQASEIACFFAEGRTVYLVNQDNRQYIIEQKLEDLESVLDQTQFYRVNRSFIININFIDNVFVFSGSRLKVELCIPIENEIIVSREKVSAFKSWISGE